MKRYRFGRVAILLLIVASNSSLQAWGQSAREILEETGVKGGLIVHIDCGDGRLTAALRDNDRYIVHGLDTDREDIETARRHIRSLGLYGPVSVQSWNGADLPYADNLAGLVVVDRPNRVSMNEVMRVLRPLGVASVKSGGKWTKTIKPWPDEIDEWTHWQHSADGNAVARDKVVDSPRRIQWVADPVWQRHHNLVPSTGAMVSSRGRMFIIQDEAQAGANAGQLPDNWLFHPLQRSMCACVPGWGDFTGTARLGTEERMAQFPRHLVRLRCCIWQIALEAPLRRLGSQLAA